MPLVIDASVAAAWLFEDERSTGGPTMEDVRAERLIVPTLWWFEGRDALVVGARSGRRTGIDSAASLRDLAVLRIEYSEFPSDDGPP